MYNPLEDQVEAPTDVNLAVPGYDEFLTTAETTDINSSNMDWLFAASSSSSSLFTMTGFPSIAAPDGGIQFTITSSETTMPRITIRRQEDMPTADSIQGGAKRGNITSSFNIADSYYGWRKKYLDVG